MPYNVFLSYNSLDRPVVLQVAKALEKRGSTCFVDQSYLLPGRDWVAALEKALADSKSVALFLGPHEMGRWQQRERAWALDRQAELPNFPVIPVLLPDCEPPLGFLKQNTWIDLRQDPADDRQLDALSAAIRGETLATDERQQPQATVCPYRGLFYFREEDAAFFFGRDKYIDKLLKKVEHRKLVAVAGASGSGKSSVVRAGLVPRLRSRDRRPVWEIATMVPGDEPLHALAGVILPLVEPELAGYDLVRKRNEVAHDLGQSKTPLWDLVAEGLRQQPGTDRLLLVVDQWEELYTQCENADARRRFIDQLLDATSHKQSPLSVVLTVRSDFYDELLQDRKLLDGLEDGKLDLGPMNDEELCSAIEKPADNVGLSFQDGLVDRLLADARNEPGRLPLLEFALEELWKRQDHGRLTHAAYENLGQLSGAIATRAEAVYAGLNEAEQAAASGLFRRLVRAGSKTEEDTRRRADLASLDETSRRVARRLADERLLVTTRGATSEAKSSAGDTAVDEPANRPDEANAKETVEVAHEELLRRWNRLKQWVNKDRGFLQWRSRLAPLLEQFKRDRHSALLRYGALREARQFYPSRTEELEDDERTFVSASVQAQRRQKQQRWSAIVAVACVVLIASWWIYHTNRKNTAAHLVQTLLTAFPDGVEYAIQQLENYGPLVIDDLHYHCTDTKLERSQRLHAAFAPARLGDFSDQELEFLLSEIPDDKPEERRNYFRALASVPNRLLADRLLDLTQNTHSPSAKRRFAATGLSVDITAPAKHVAILAEDPAARTELIHSWAEWLPDLRALPELLRENSDDDPFCSAVCSALGLLDADSLPSDEKEQLAKVLQDLYVNAPGGATHSSTGWALRQWGKAPLPSVPQSKEIPADRNWFVNEHGMTFVLIPKPKGKFRMGSAADDPAAEPDEHAHFVRLSEDFFLSDREVTIGQFEAVMGRIPSGIEMDEGDRQAKLRPVKYVSWFDAVEFCNLLSKKEGISPYYDLVRDDKGVIVGAEIAEPRTAGYRLPTEAQWEYACRARSSDQFCYGDEPDLNRPRLLSDYAIFSASKIATTGSKLPNAWGLFDMHGNVEEWCADWYDEGYYTRSPEVDPTNRDEASHRVFRGGSWLDVAGRCRSAYRDGSSPGHRLESLGFRLAAVPPSQQARNKSK